MPKIDKKDFVLLWLFNPFLSAIYLFKNFRDNTNIYPYLLLSIFFGISFVVSTVGADSARYAIELMKYHEESYSFGEILKGFYGEEGNNVDIYQPFVTWIVSLFTSNVKVLFAIFSLVFGYFWFKSLILIRSYIRIPLVGLALTSFLFLALTNPIWEVNGVRMWTAVGIFFYGLLLLTLKNNKKGWIFLVFALFVHFSLAISLILYVTYLILPTKNKTLLFGSFIITFFFGELNLDFLRGLFEQLPGFMESRKSYISEAYIDKISDANSKVSIHVVVAQFITKYSVVLMTVLMYIYLVFHKKKMTKPLEILFTLGLIFGSFSNLALSVPSGGRFLVLSNLIIISSFLLFLNQRISMSPMLKKLLSISLFVVIIFKIRMGLEFIGLFFFIGNPIVNWFVIDSPIIEFIKSLI